MALLACGRNQLTQYNMLWMMQMQRKAGFCFVRQVARCYQMQNEPIENKLTCGKAGQLLLLLAVNFVLKGAKLSM